MLKVQSCKQKEKVYLLSTQTPSCLLSEVTNVNGYLHILQGLFYTYIRGKIYVYINLKFLKNDIINLHQYKSRKEIV